MRKPRLTKAVSDGLMEVASLAREDMASDDKRDWGNAPKGLEYIIKLARWYTANIGGES